MTMTTTNLCKCGCGGQTKYGREYVWGHKTPDVRPAEPKNQCACGCGTFVRGKWSKGHCNRMPEQLKPRSGPCECGCGGLASPGVRFIAGHNSKTDSDKLAKSKKFEQLWRDGRFANRRVWNRGLTKETDPRLAENGKKISAAFTPERIEQYKKFGREVWSQHLQHGSGPDHPNWKGGRSDIYQMLYGSSRLYREWKYPILAAADFSCVACGASRIRLNVHHHPVKMKQIVDMFHDGSDMTFDEKKIIAGQVIDYHLEPGVRGICLCVVCHHLAHSSSGSDDVDIEV